MSDSAPAAPAPAQAGNGRRRRLLGSVLATFVIAGIAAFAWWFLVGRWHEETDDAYVNGDVVQITPQVSGTVIAVRVADTDYVKAGQELVQLDRADGRIALDQAEAQLARSVRQVRNLLAGDAPLAALVAQREAESARIQADALRAQADLERAQADLARREKAQPGAVSGEELQHARDALTAARASRVAAREAGAAAQAAVNASREQARANRTLTEHFTIAEHPEVKAAAARFREAYLAYARTTVPAPISGYVARRTVQVGQRVAGGNPMMAVVPLDRIWIDANFKESQIAGLRVGQPARVHADVYGSAVEYHGRVAGFGAGTGAAFALLPAQNATGNWIKVVQRVPVRIALDPNEVAQHPLQVGLSMRVDIDTHERSGIL